mgnify:CR=1 FL=1
MDKIWWQRWRGRLFTLGIILIFLLIEIRLFSMQVIARSSFHRQAGTNCIRADVIEPRRGDIFDRRGVLLVENRPSYTLFVYPWIARSNQRTIDGLAASLGITSDEIKRRIARRGWHTFQPATILRDVNFSLLARLEATKLDLPGIAFGFVPKRSCLLPEAVHLLGYVGEPEDEPGVSDRSRFGLVGRHGIEAVYEPLLSGKPGVRYIQVDAQGRQIEVLTDPPGIPPQRGWDLYLNIDADLQRYACILMEDHQGAVAVIDPRDGAVLTLLSLPDYDPSLFSGVLAPETWKSLAGDPGHPLLNRAVQGLYPPGSTFKMVVLSAAVEEGLISPDFRVKCTGGIQLGNRFFNCWKPGGHGSVGWAEALQQSCDVFFYTVGLKLGVDRIAEFAHRFGFGEPTGIDFDVEKTGIVPDVDYLNEKYGVAKWTEGQTLNIAIGQGDLLVTPLQLALYTGAIATGRLVQPRIAGYAIDPATGDTISFEPKFKPLRLNVSTLKMLREGMRMVVNEPHGTAHRMQHPEFVIAGKTGTSQNPHGEDHGLFVAFAPFLDPLIAVAVVVEHGGHGSSSAAPIACRLIDRYLTTVYPGPYEPPYRPRLFIHQRDTVAIE